MHEQVEKLLAEFVMAERKRRAEQDARLDLAIAAWNDFGSFADEHSNL